MKNRKLLKTCFLAFSAIGMLAASSSTAARATKSGSKQKPQSIRQQTRSAGAPALSARAGSGIQRALELAKAGNYVEASLLLYRMQQGEMPLNVKMQIKYVLGLMLYEMHLDQVAAFQFIEVVRDGNSSYVRKSLEKLSLAANTLNNDTLLSFALSKAKLAEFPKAYHDMLYFRIGEIQRKRGDLEQAISSFSKVRSGSEWYSKAKYLQGLSYVESNHLDQGLASFNDIIRSRSSKSVTDKNLVAGLMGVARVKYQQEKWDAAIDAYRQVPRDTELWHDSVFEISWAYMRSAQFRNVLSELHSLHSPYYDEYYMPESVLLRAIVYLYICQYEEMDKTLDFFERTYKPVLNQISQILKTETRATRFFQEVMRFSKADGTFKKPKDKGALPMNVARSILREGDLQRTLVYIDRLEAEKKRIEGLSVNWKRSTLGAYALKVVNSRLANSRIVAGKMVQVHLSRMKKHLEELFENHGFARYELARGRKEVVQKEIAGKGLSKARIDDDNSREFYVQNGFEYWPFQGEYWLDEIGNYHYVGVQSCER